jgi:hypothetical protein
MRPKRHSGIQQNPKIIDHIYQPVWMQIVIVNCELLSFANKAFVLLQINRSLMVIMSIQIIDRSERMQKKNYKQRW